jgi:hypothetical protein
VAGEEASDSTQRGLPSRALTFDDKKDLDLFHYRPLALS